MIQDDINFDDGFRFGLNNRNLYINSSYKNKFGNNWKIEGGLSFTNDKSTIKVIEDKIDANEYRMMTFLNELTYKEMNFEAKMENQLQNVNTPELLSLLDEFYSKHDSH